MELYSEGKSYKLYKGNMLDMLDVIEPCSIDSIVTDPPYELNFMGKSWDNSGIAFQKETWEKCLKALKPGGHLLAFGGTRTYHRIACAIEDAGFEIRDCIMYIYGSGFPKSMALDKAIEGKLTTGSGNKTQFKHLNGDLVDRGNYGYSKMQYVQDNRPSDYNLIDAPRLDKLKPTTELAQKYQGWGTALKPAYEPIILARKPVEKSIVDNVIKYGVGGLNIDECRIPFDGDKWVTQKSGASSRAFQSEETTTAGGLCEANDLGRFPSNLIHDGSEDAISGFPHAKGNDPKELGDDDGGSASRYFYCAKASKEDRDEGLDDFEEKKVYGDDMQWGYGNSNGDNFGDRIANVTRKNTHPTVKPLSLMRYLVKLVTPNGGVVLDPFNGSGSTGKAVMYENVENHKDYTYIGIELTEEYLPISKARIEYASKLKDVYVVTNGVQKKVIVAENKSSENFSKADLLDFDE